MYGYAGSELPYYFFPIPLESKAEREAAIGHLEREFTMDTEDYHYFTSLGEPHTIPVKKTWSHKRWGGVDWYL